ncbi:hypothetical protein FRC01_006692 [Tulasnella sp. 417]|nr:hypothetical protein FRC01_006692 [Tulasnella sp. 417]
MRFFTLVAFAASLVSASVLSERQASFPACSVLCFTDPNIGTCPSTDVACLCTNNDYLRTTTDCVQKQCTLEDVAAAANAARQLCNAAGVDIATNPAAQPTDASGSAILPTSTSASVAGTDSVSAPATTTASEAPASTTTTQNAAATGSVVGKGMIVGGFVAAAAVLAL